MLFFPLEKISGKMNNAKNSVEKNRPLVE